MGEWAALWGLSAVTSPSKAKTSPKHKPGAAPQRGEEKTSAQLATERLPSHFWPGLGLNLSIECWQQPEGLLGSPRAGLVGSQALR